MESCFQNINRILTTQEVADILKIHRTTVCRLAISGEIKSHLIGRSRRYYEDDVKAFFDNRVDRVNRKTVL